MWYAAVVRILRRRVVLTIIFLLSLTYCLVNLWGNVRPLKSHWCNVDKIWICCFFFLFCRVEMAPKNSKRLSTNGNSHWYGVKTTQPMVQTKRILVAAAIQFKEKHCLSTMRAMSALEIICCKMDAVIQTKILFSTAVIRAMNLKGAALSMRNVSAAVWIPIKWVGGIGGISKRFLQYL